MVTLPVHAVYMQSIPQKDKIHYQVLQYLVYKYWLLHLLKLKGFQVTDTRSHLKAKPRRNPLEKKAGLNVHEEKAQEIQK